LILLATQRTTREPLAERRNVQSKRGPKTWKAGMVEKRFVSVSVGESVDEEGADGGGNDARSWTMVEMR
jgi:hypothetical protein